MNDLTIPGNLVEQLCRGNCVLFVGAGIGMGEGGLPGGGQLAQELAQRCDYPGDDLALARVAQYYADTIDKADLLQYVCQRVREARREPMETHQLIAVLPFKIIVSTNYDCLIERALEAAGRPFNVIVTDKQVGAWDEGVVNLLKIHGCVTQWESIVLTKDDYWEFFEGRPNIANILSAEAARRSLLFVGHGLGDDDFNRIYLQVTRNLAEFRHKSYAVQLHPNPVDVTLWKGKRLEIMDADAAVFLAALREAVKAAGPIVEIKEEIPRPERPYKFLDYFEARDVPIFYGRELEAPELQRLIMAHKLTVLYGASGVGKTSLLQAGVMPRLREDGYTTFYVRSLENPAQAFKAEALRLTRGPESQLDEEAKAVPLRSFLRRVLPPETRLVVFLDQFEEFFIRLGDGVRRAFIEELAACLEDDALEMRAVLSLRDDYFVRLDEFSARWPGVFDNRFRLRNLDEDRARLAIFLPARQFNLSYEDALLQQLLADLESGGVEPAQLQIVCYRLYEDLVAGGWSADSGQPGTFTLAQYQRLGGTGAILAGYLDDVLAKLPEEEREPARGVLKSMVTGQETKAALSAREIARDEIVRRLGLDEGTVGRILTELRDSRVVRKLTLAEGESYELAHEVMVDKVWQWVTEEEARFKHARDMLRQDLNNYRNLDLLMPLDRLEIVNLYRDEMSLSRKELELLFRSALAAGYEVVYWRDRADQAGLLEQLEEEWLAKLASDDAQTVTAAITGLGGIGRPRLVEQLARMVEADFTIDRSAPRPRGARGELRPRGRGHEPRDVLYLSTTRQRRAVAALSKMTGPEATAALGRWTPQGMILIPAGPFIMGSTESGDEGPVHRVWLDAFWLARTPVTNAEYAEFIAAGGYRERGYWTEVGWKWRGDRTEPKEWDKHKGKRDHPVRYITWYEALAYARWRGAMLPSEAQWEEAARGGLQIPRPESLARWRSSRTCSAPTERETSFATPEENFYDFELVDNPNPERRYPWGDQFDRNKCNTSESKVGDTTPVGKYSPQGDSPYGLADMAGNVWEWTSSLSPYPYKAEDDREDSGAEGGSRVLRGGSFVESEVYARCSCRLYDVPVVYWHYDVGCRVGWCAAL